MKIIKLLTSLFLLIGLNIYSTGKSLYLFVDPKIAHASISMDSFQVFLPLVQNEKMVGYFVSPDGNDSNPGTIDLPWKTIGKAARTVIAGDIVYIRKGVYHEAVSFEKSGTSSNPIVIQAFPGENPIIDGFHIIPGTGSYLLQVKGSYVHLDGIEVRNSAYGGVFLYGNYNIVRNLFVHHSKYPGFVISNGKYSLVENNRIWRNSLRNESGSSTSWSAGLSASRLGVNHVTIRKNHVWENWGEGISSYEADNIIIEDNISHDNYSTNIYISDSTNVLCQRNFVYMNPSSYVYGLGANAGIMLGDEKYTPPSSDIQVINNIAYGNSVNFWWWQGDDGGGMKNVLIANNTFVNATSPLNKGRGNVTISWGEHVNVRFISNLVQQDNELPVIATHLQPGITYSHNLWSKKPYDAASGIGDVIGDPKLLKVGSPFLPDWFKLSTTSPAINKALLLPQVTIDYFGQLRGTSPDIGADELDK